MTTNPTDLRARAKAHMDNWRAWWRFDPIAASDELDLANDLLALAEEVEAAELRRVA